MKLIVNKGSRRLGIPGHPAVILNPGESIPVDKLQQLEINRNKTLLKWLARGTLVWVEEKDIPPIPPKVDRPGRPAIARPEVRRQQQQDVRVPVVYPKGVTGNGVEIYHKGGGWFVVYVNGFVVTDSNIRKDEAERVAAEYA